MSNIQNEQWLADMDEDFDFFLWQEKWSDCEAVIAQVGEQGFETEALRMHTALNRAKATPELNMSTAEGVAEFMRRINKALYGI